MMTILEELKKKFKNRLLFKENLAKYTWFNTGGNAEVFFKPDNQEDLVFFLRKVQPKKITILGAGSNTLIRDGGIDGITIKLGSSFSFTNLTSDGFIEAGGASLDKKVADFAAENSITGLEFLACIPGSIGGAIIMNSGCYDQDMSKVLNSITIIRKNGEEKIIQAKDIKFKYRGTNFVEDFLITKVRLKGNKSSKSEILAKQKYLVSKKKEAQPTRIKTCGSTFKNTQDKKAWELIKQSGCDNFRVGSARISEKHCNFFINEGQATAKDLEELITKVQQTVLEKTKISLEPEIKIIGKY